MEELYYTPKIEELFVGYKCEITYAKNEDDIYWIPTILTLWDINTILEEKEGNFRTKYLDKEDIINEGWVIDSAYSLKKDGWYIECNLDNIKSDTVHIFLEQDKRFDGNIKSINEFKKIIEWIYQ